VEAADVASWLCEASGLDYGSAHAVVARALASGGLSAVGLERAAEEVLGLSISVDPAQVASLSEPRALVARRTAPGAPGDLPAIADAQDAERQDIARAVEDARARWSQAETRTIAEARSIVNAQGGRT